MVEQVASPLNGVFAAVADPTRRAILRQLGRGPARVTDIAKRFPVSLNAVSKHLLVLRRAGLVRQQVRGRERICSLDGQPLRGASAWIEEMQSVWEGRLDATERHPAMKRDGGR
jgi:DNA-binding transcriptional ArsR family regulator